MKASLLAVAVLAGVALPSAIAASETVEPQAVRCTPIKNARQLQAIRNNLAGSYCLTNDIDARSIENFVPIGDEVNPFTGRLFGNGWVIRNLNILSDAPYVGLFGRVQNAVIQDLGLVKVRILATAPGADVGGLAGQISVEGLVKAEIRRIHVTGTISVTTSASNARVGGIAGFVGDLTLTDSWTDSTVFAEGNSVVGGLIGFAAASSLSRVSATGPVACLKRCRVGGLVGAGADLTIERSQASGLVQGGDSSAVGGLIGYALTSLIRLSHALGPVTTGARDAGAGTDGDASAGGIVGLFDENDSVSALWEVYATGPVKGGAGAVLGGIVGKGTLDPDKAQRSYWDTVTSGQAADPIGVGYTTSQLRAALPPGFGNAWAITGKRSYPFLNEAEIEFAAPLATLVVKKRIYTFLPISQHDVERDGAKRSAKTLNVDSLAIVYTMIARAIGITRNIEALFGVPVERYFWDDETQTATWRGPVTKRATLGTFAAIPANVPLTETDVINEMNSSRLVMLRGRYRTADGTRARHWLLGTLYMTVGKKVSAIVANDPWTGRQVTIDPATKRVVSPENFPLNDFIIDGYQPVTLK